MNIDNNFIPLLKQDQYLFGDESCEAFEKKTLLLRCSCTCTAISIDKWDDEDEYYITFYPSYVAESSFFRRVKEAYKTLIGKNNEKFGVVLSTEEFNKIKEL